MADDLKNVRLSSKASEIANRIYEYGFFEDRINICQFALSYAVAKHLDEIDLDMLDTVYDSGGSNYNIGSLDGDKYISQLIASIYPNTTTPYRNARILMIFGLEKLGTLLDEGALFPLHQWL